MAEYRIIQETGHSSVDIISGDSLEELVEKASEMEGLKA